MPRQFDSCVASLTEQGESQEFACRACEMAFWNEHGLTIPTALAANFDPQGADLAEAAGVIAAELAAGDQEDSVFVVLGPMHPVESEALLSYGAAVQAEGGEKALLRECEVLTPGTYNGFPFSADELRDYARNHSPADPPPIIKDHNLKDADNGHGYVRGMRYDEESQMLLCLAEFLGSHAVERVKDKRWKKLSGRFNISENPERRRMTELSVTLKPAFTGSRIGRKKEAPMSKGSAEQAKLSAQNGTEKPVPTPPPETEATLTKSAREIELEAKLAAAEEQAAKKDSDFEAKLAARRAREDEKDWQLLLHAGVTEPHMKDAELSFMGQLPEDLKEAYIELSQGRSKATRYGRQSTPTVPEAVEDTTALLADDKKKQEVMLAAAQAALGQTTTNGKAAEGSH